MSYHDSYPSIPDTEAKPVNGPNIDPSQAGMTLGPRTAINTNTIIDAKSTTNVSNIVEASRPLILKSAQAANEEDDLAVAPTGAGFPISASGSFATKTARAVISTPLSGNALTFVPAKAAAKVHAAAGPTYASMAAGAGRSLTLEQAKAAANDRFAAPTDPSITVNADKMSAAWAIKDPFSDQVPQGPRRHPVFQRSKPASPLAYTDRVPFLDQVPLGLRQQLPWSKPVSPSTPADNYSFQNQLPADSQRQLVSSWSKATSPLTRTNKDRVINQVPSGPQHEPVLDWLKTSSPLMKEDDTTLSTPTTSHQRVTSSPWNQRTSAATTPLSDPSRPRLRVQIPNTPSGPIRERLPPSVPQGQPSYTNTKTFFNQRLAAQAARPHPPSTRKPATSTPHTNILNPAPSHTNSRTWTNPKTALHERWLSIEKKLQKMEFIEGPDNPGKGNIHRSPFVPTTFAEYIEHRRLYNQDRLNERKRKLAALEKASIRDPRLPPPGPKNHIKPAFGGKQFHDNRSGVLSQFTVYSPYYQPQKDRPEAPWPCPQEMAEEGDERYTSNFRRMTAVPRDPCNETVSYKQRPFILPFPLDATWGAYWRVPTLRRLERIAKLGFEMEAEKEIGEEYIGQWLMDALDCVADDE